MEYSEGFLHLVFGWSQSWPLLFSVQLLFGPTGWNGGNSPRLFLLMSLSPPCSSQVRRVTGVSDSWLDCSSLRMLWLYLDGSYFMDRTLMPFCWLSCRMGRTRPNLLTTQFWTETRMGTGTGGRGRLENRESLHPHTWCFWGGVQSCDPQLMFPALHRRELSDTLCPGTSVPGTAALIVKFSTPAPLRESSSFCLLSSADEFWRPCSAAACLSSSNLTHRKINIHELKCFKIHRCQRGGEFCCSVCKMKRDSFLCALFYRCWEKKNPKSTSKSWKVPF